MVALWMVALGTRQPAGSFLNARMAEGVGKNHLAQPGADAFRVERDGMSDGGRAGVADLQCSWSSIEAPAAVIDRALTALLQ